MSRNRQKWTAAEDAVLIADHAKGVSYLDLGRQLRPRRTAIACNSRLSYLRRVMGVAVPVRNLARDDVAEIPRAPVTITKRACLSCDRVFERASPYLYLCPGCRSQASGEAFTCPVSMP